MKKKLISLALAAVMVVMMGTPVLGASEKFPFEDVPSDHWARQAVYFITMMGRATYQDEINAQIISSDSWYSGYVRYLYSCGYLDGIPIDDASLSQGIPRQEMAFIIYNI